MSVFCTEQMLHAETLHGEFSEPQIVHKAAPASKSFKLSSEIPYFVLVGLVNKFCTDIHGSLTMWQR